MTSPSPDVKPRIREAIGRDTAARFSGRDASQSIRRFVLGSSWLPSVLSGLATLAILLVLGWFFLVSPYSGPAEFVYNQF
jgi:hypothetical protein